MKFLQKEFLGTILTVLLLQVLTHPAFAKEDSKLEPSQKNWKKGDRTDRIFCGRGLLLSCKCYFFQSLGSENIPKAIKEVREKDPSFLGMRTWAYQNVLSILNRPNYDAAENSTCALHMYSYDAKGELALLIAIPLGPKQLGPNYLEKLEELRSILKEARNVKTY